jgi:hypothetical protein
MKDPLLSRYTSADLRFDPFAHTTSLPDGRDVPHVTKILAEVGVAIDFEEVMTLSRRHRAQVEDRRELGTVVHAALHYVDDNDLAWDTLSVTGPMGRTIGDPANAGCRYQTAAYVAAYLAEHPDEHIDDRWAIQLIPDRQVPYAITSYGRYWRDDYRTFQSFLTTYRSQQRTA